MKVEIGPGINKLGKDWIGVGTYESPSVDHICWWGIDNLPFEDNSVEIFYASHVIEHVWWYLLDKALADVYRCLKPNGIIELHTVDFAHVVQSYLNKQCGDQWRRNNPEGDFMTWVNGKLFAYNPPEALAHHSCFDRPYLIQKLKKAGFRNFEKVDEPRVEPHGSNLGIRGVK